MRARHRAGLGQRLRHAVAELKDVLRELTPERRRARFGDIEFDWDTRADTTAANIGLITRMRGVVAGSQYQPADPALFAESMAALPIDFSSYVFIDAGSGKGRALMMACRYPFRRVIGIEVVPELHAIAERNLHQRGDEFRVCSSATSWLGDAVKFPWPAEPTVLFLFNPFPEWVLRETMARLGDSLREKPRAVWVIYHNPVLEHVLAESGFLRKVSGKLEAAVYTNDFR